MEHEESDQLPEEGAESYTPDDDGDGGGSRSDATKNAGGDDGGDGGDSDAGDATGNPANAG
jgi:hypothetical protein